MKKFTLLTVLLAIFTLVSCSDTQKQADSALTAENSIVVKSQGKDIRVPINPQRVVVFSLGALDTFDALGIADKVVGFPKTTVPKYLDKFKNNEAMANTGSLVEPNFQKINELRPDLIIIGARQLRDYDRFAEIAPTIVYNMDLKDYINSVKSNIQTVGKIFQIKDVAQKRSQQMLKVLNAEKAKVDTTAKALMVMFNDGKFSAFGAGSRFGYIHDFFNVEPVDEHLKVSTHGNSISSEYIQEKNPDILFVLDRNAAIGKGDINKKAVENALVQETNAYKNGKIIYLTPDVWYLAGGGIQSLETMAKEVGSAF